MKGNIHCIKSNIQCIKGNIHRIKGKYGNVSEVDQKSKTIHKELLRKQEDKEPRLNEKDNTMENRLKHQQKRTLRRLNSSRNGEATVTDGINIELIKNDREE